MEGTNNFKEINGYHSPPQEVRNTVRKNLVNMRFVGNLVDLYVIKPVGLLIRPPKNILRDQNKK